VDAKKPVSRSHSEILRSDAGMLAALEDFPHSPPGGPTPHGSFLHSPSFSASSSSFRIRDRFKFGGSVDQKKLEEEAKILFDSHDKKKTGYLDRKEGGKLLEEIMSAAMKSLPEGQRATEEEVRNFIEAGLGEMDGSLDDKILWEAFLEMLSLEPDDEEDEDSAQSLGASPSASPALTPRILPPPPPSKPIAPPPPPPS